MHTMGQVLATRACLYNAWVLLVYVVLNVLGGLGWGP